MFPLELGILMDFGLSADIGDLNYFELPLAAQKVFESPISAAFPVEFPVFQPIHQRTPAMTNIPWRRIPSPHRQRKYGLVPRSLRNE